MEGGRHMCYLSLTGRLSCCCASGSGLYVATKPHGENILKKLYSLVRGAGVHIDSSNVMCCCVGRPMYRIDKH